MTRLLAILAMLAMPIAASAQTSFETSIDGAQAIGCEPGGAGTGPSVGTGSGTFTLDLGTSMLSYDISFSGLEGTESAAHVHGPAPAGTPAGVVFPLPAGSPKVGSSRVLLAGEIADLQAGQYYVNIHSNLCPDGEIRGQILATSGVPVLGMYGFVALGGFLLATMFWMMRRRAQAGAA